MTILEQQSSLDQTEFWLILLPTMMPTQGNKATSISGGFGNDSFLKIQLASTISVKIPGALKQMDVLVLII